MAGAWPWAQGGPGTAPTMGFGVIPLRHQACFFMERPSHMIRSPVPLPPLPPFPPLHRPPLLPPLPHMGEDPVNFISEIYALWYGIVSHGSGSWGHVLMDQSNQ